MRMEEIKVFKHPEHYDLLINGALEAIEVLYNEDDKSEAKNALMRNIELIKEDS